MTSVALSSERFKSPLAETAEQKLLSKGDIVQQGGLREPTLLQKVAPILIRESLLADSVGSGGLAAVTPISRSIARRRRRGADSPLWTIPGSRCRNRSTVASST